MRPWPPPKPLPVIKVVGVSAAGKSTLVAGLRAAGFDARPVSQEHSNVPTLWRRFDAHKVLIYLDVTLEAQRERRADVSWDAAARATEVARLADARAHADLAINTTSIAAATVLALALAFLRERGIRSAPGPLPPVAPTGAPVK